MTWFLTHRNTLKTILKTTTNKYDDKTMEEPASSSNATEDVSAPTEEKEE